MAILQKFNMLIAALLFLTLNNVANAQAIEKVYKSNIESAQLYAYGNQQGLPVYILGGNERMELHFDDLDANLKSYYYTYVWCDYNWNPVQLSPFDYIKGFTNNRISTYRYSSIALTRYTHYQAILPEQNSIPTKSGNYILKVYLNGDTSKLVFTKRLLVVEKAAGISAQVIQPFTPDLFKTHQKVKFNANLIDVNSFSAAQQVKAVILQNNRWDQAQKNIAPTFVRGASLEFNSENTGIFPGGKEWRWLDLRSLRLLSDRVRDGEFLKDSTILFLKTDIDRRPERYVYFPDYNGMYQITTYETINPLWQGDYALVNFSLAMPNGALPNEDIYLTGAFTGYDKSEKWKMKFNEETNLYETTAFLKQGYYNYSYTAVSKSDIKKETSLEGNYWETENSYTILLYYKAFTDRNDRLIGISQINSRTDKPGFSF